MKIAKDQLRTWGACRDGYEWFLRTFMAGEAEYQAVLDALAAADRPSDAHWLMDHAGADRTAVLEVDSIADTEHLFFAGRIVIARGATLSGALRAGDGIEAGEGIEAGKCIEAGEGIKAGEGWACFAGLRIRVADWSTHANVLNAQRRGRNWKRAKVLREETPNV